LTKLNPWVVGLHFLATIAVITAAFAFWRSTVESDETATVTVKAPLWTLAGLTTLACAGVLVVGVMVTGSGPHAGDDKARRNGLDPQAIAQVHADLVFLVLGLAIALWLALRAVGSPAYVQARLLVTVLLAQGLIGFVQYFTNLPIVLVGAHMLGACLVWLATLAVLWAVRVRPAAAVPEAARATLVTSAS
jgi:cytochrome c oxidase assembly protein subunit 15